MSNQVFSNANTINPQIPQGISVNAQLHLTTSQSIASNPLGANVRLTYDTIDISSPAVTYSTSTGVITIVMPGIYTFTMQTVFATNNAGDRGSAFVYNSGAIYGLSVGPALLTVGGTNLNSLVSTFVRQMNAGDTVSAQCFQNSGGALNAIGSATNATYFCLLSVVGVVW